MERVLEEPDTCRPLPVGSIEDRAHQLSARTAVLSSRIDGDGADAADWRTLVEKVATDDDAILLGDDGVEAGMRDQHLGDADAGLS